MLASLMPLIAVSPLLLPLCEGAVVFSDDFSEPSGTILDGKLPDNGSAWDAYPDPASDPAPVISDQNSFNTSGGGKRAFGNFTDALGPGQTLTLSYDTLDISFGSGWAGVSLFATEYTTFQDYEGFFTGKPNDSGEWGIAGSASGGPGDGIRNSTAVTHAEFTYLYDTGAWTFTTTAGVNLSGNGAANVAFDYLRVANGGGADIHIDNLVVDISPVPEPASALLLGLGIGFGAFRRRR